MAIALLLAGIEISGVALLLQVFHERKDVVMRHSSLRKKLFTAQNQAPFQIDDDNPLRFSLLNLKIHALLRMMH